MRIRRNVIGLRRPSVSPVLGVGLDRLATLSASHSAYADADDDGLVDLVEAAVGLDPRRADSDGDGVADGDEDHDGDGVSNRLALGVTGDPFLTVAQLGTARPFEGMWQTKRKVDQAPYPGPPPGWVVTTTSQALLTQRMPAALRARAFARGFSLFVRATPRASWDVYAPRWSRIW